MKNQTLSVQQAIRRLVIAVVLLFLAGAAIGVAGGIYVVGVAHRGDKAYLAACAQKEQLQQTVMSTVRFLEEHPNGFAGIPASTLALTVRNQARSVYTLQSYLDCDSPDLGPLPPLPG